MSDSSETADDADDKNTPDPQNEVDSEGYRTLASGELSPRHRRLAFLAAQGKSNKEICEELKYSDSRVSILRKNPHIASEIARLTERIYEETIGTRLKSFAEPALNVLERALTDRTNRIKESEKIDVAKWVIEKIDGKAAQKIEAGENMLAVLMDRLDAAKTSRPVVNVSLNVDNRGQNVTPYIDVTPTSAAKPPLLEAQKTEEDLLADWVTDFTGGS